ncbi:MAG TPA: biopolymer transporter ExbD [Polyangiales bacterium]|jgi:biopolymer transport protein ExbD|nr:biopolymer transporter ExbD [Polyangiales bacterium]
MPVRVPGKVLLRDVPLEFVSKKVSGHGSKAVDVSIPLIPFIDFLIVLVVFLLISFSASGELLAQKANLKMPKASNVVDIDISPVIAVDPVVITLDGRRMADTATLAADPKVERIEQLIQDLETLKRNWSILHPQEPFPGQVILQADVSIDYRVIKKLMFSTAQAGYANVSFAVNRTGEKK